MLTRSNRALCLHVRAASPGGVRESGSWASTGGVSPLRRTRVELSTVFPISGFLVGVLIGLTGMGAGALMTPYLILVLGTRPIVAVGTDLAYGAVTKLVGAFLHWRQGTVDLRLVARLALGSVPAGLAGVCGPRRDLAIRRRCR